MARGGKLLTRFVARDQRASLIGVEGQLNDLVVTVDDFYDLLGDRHSRARGQPRTLTPDRRGFEDEPIHGLATEVLEAWEPKNYGRMAAQLASLTREETPGKSAGRVRNEYMLVELEDFRIVRLDFQAPVICEIDIELTIGGETKPGRIRWIRETDDGRCRGPVASKPRVRHDGRT